MSEALISSLNSRISELMTEKANLNAAIKEARRERKEATEKLDALTKQVETLTTERDGFKAKAEAGPTEQTKRITELESQIRGRDFRDAFRAAARTANVNEAHIDDLFTLSGLKPPESGDIKPEGFTEFLTAAATSKPWAFATADANANPPASGGSTAGTLPGATPKAPPPGAGRSASSPPTAQVRYTSAEVATPGWQARRPELVEALKAGAAVRVG